VLETALGAIARLRLFEIETPVEAKEGEDFEHQRIGLRRVSLRSATLLHIISIASPLIFTSLILTTSSPSTIAINNISLTIQPGQMVVICGRTGR
jgi:ABC-type multidrug transport system fused ATPase/permease subunit